MDAIVRSPLRRSPLSIVVMGVSSCGKSTIGKAIAEKLDIPFEDGDSYHPEANIAKMKSGACVHFPSWPPFEHTCFDSGPYIPDTSYNQGLPLDDYDRKEWLVILSKLLSNKVAEGTGVVVACSALKVSYRNLLRELHGNDDEKVVHFVFIKGSFELMEKRIKARTGHFMPPSLLKSQFDTLQEPVLGEVGDVGLPEGALVTVDAEWDVPTSASYAAHLLSPLQLAQS